MTNQTLVQIPSGRDTIGVETQQKTFNWNLKAPKNKVLQSIKIRARCNVGGTPGAAAYFHKLFSEIKLEGETGTMLHALEDSIPMTAVLSHVKKEDNMYEAAPANTDIVRNPSMTTNGTNYDCTLDFHCPAPGKNFVLSVGVKKIVTILTWATSAAFDIIATAKWTTYRGQKQYATQGAENNAISEKTFSNVTAAALVADASWGGLGTVKLGEALNSEQIDELEDLTNDNLRGLAANSTGTTRTLPIADPADGAAVYVVFKDFETPGEVVLKLNAATSFYSVMFKEDGGF